MPGIATLIFVAAVMFCVLSGVTLLAHIYNLNNIKSKTVGDGQHGMARWATKSEIRKTYTAHLPAHPIHTRALAGPGRSPSGTHARKWWSTPTRHCHGLHRQKRDHRHGRYR